MLMKLVAAVLLACVHAFACAQTAAPSTFRVQCTGSTCNIKIVFKNGTPGVDIEELEVVKGNRNVHIVWHLPSGFLFNANLGDGVFLKSEDDGQFTDHYATDDDNGAMSGNGRRGKNYHWKNLNTVAKSYKYKVQFRDQNGNQFLFDPTIINDG